MTLRLIGEVDAGPYREFGQLLIRRVLHQPMGSFGYVKRTPTIPEIGVCWDFLNHPCIDRRGNLSICVRFDPRGEGRLGNLGEHTLEELWNGPRRRAWLEQHVSGCRSEVPLCSRCEYWGVPISP